MGRKKPFLTLSLFISLFTVMRPSLSFSPSLFFSFFRNVVFFPRFTSSFLLPRFHSLARTFNYLILFLSQCRPDIIFFNSKYSLPCFRLTVRCRNLLLHFIVISWLVVENMLGFSINFTVFAPLYSYCALFLTTVKQDSTPGRGKVFSLLDCLRTASSAPQSPAQ